MILIIGVAVLLIIIVVIALVAAKLEGDEEKEENLPYELKRYFFTRSEQEFFNILNAKLDAHRYTIFPKVRLGDIVDIKAGIGKRNGWWARIRSRHVDFVVWDLVERKFTFAIELDGSSHHGNAAQKTDRFKDLVFKTVGLPLHRVRVGSNFEAEIDRIIS